MNASDLAAKLREMYLHAPRGESVVMIHLFGVRYADQIRGSGVSCKQLAVAAGIQESYAAEINKGINLARYVTPNQ